MSADARLFAMISGGGTGGHVYPPIALAQELVRRGHPGDSIRLVGVRGRLEERAWPEAGFAVDLLPGRGLRRRLTLENVAVVRDTARAFVAARRLVRRFRPRVVVGFGGYGSLPLVAAARASRVPTLVHEQDAAPGLANRIAVRLGARAAVSLPDTPLPGSTRTGNPVRREMVELVRSPSSPPLLAVVGGSLGARTLNVAALDLYRRWRDRDDVAVHHVTGPRNYDECAQRLASLRRAGDALDYVLVPYEERLDGVYARASLALCRAGAGTVAELTAAGVPSVLVPLPGAPADHQTRNAETLARAGAALVLRDDECDGARVDELVAPLLHDRARLDAMSVAARSIARPDAAARLADLVEEVAGVRA
ncbi:MAG TPA: UDP-N-acetylglucosamine--N-acetylmuramyl-(pentapeptide) pyrophosphoryl-undecaprenol N-acetylglucosamine transferase [Acidimicrobiia bacterium]|nr:UDP-N-acetylglucosamine--N-acetylmuramyl-(pentapeptide) pyrophosphoryl-undecaprenol N-acetylglucosamine transferase [Acidimicrobiia bacterium]